MAKKIIIIGVIILIGVVAGLSLFKGKGGLSSSPEAVMKAFFEEVNKGNFEEAEEYLDGSVESFFDVSFSCSSFNLSATENDSLKKECLNSLIGAIQDVEIVSKKEIDSNLIKLRVKVILDSGLAANASQLIEANKTFTFVKDEETKKRMEKEAKKGSFLKGFIHDFEEEREFEMVKWKEGWKITG